MKPMPLAWIPNDHGFGLWGVRADGTLLLCEVERGADRLHRVKGVPLSDLVGWYRVK